jgi:hypothetical protein
MTPNRTEFGFTRTECACEQCIACCENLPAYLVPSDIEAIATHLGYDNPVHFAMECDFQKTMRLWRRIFALLHRSEYDYEQK